MSQAILDTAKARFKQAYESEAAQRLREREDLDYQIPENQWPEAARRERAGADGFPPRPMLSVSLLSQPLQQIYNQVANAQLGVNVHPVSENASKELAEVRQELYRRIERDSNAAQARLWALLRALHCGRGWYEVVTAWDEDADNPWDQEIRINRLLHQDMIYMDPAAQMADYSDARWGMKAAWVPLEDFRKLYPKATVAVSDFDFQGICESEPLWARNEGGSKAVLVVEYWHKEQQVQVIEHPTRKGVKREIVTVRADWCKLTGVEVLDQEEGNGQYIPYIPVIGKELQPINGERMWEGLVRPARGAQQFFNYSITNAVERMALEPRAPFVVYKEQIKGHEQYWNEANRRNWPYLPANLLTADQKVLPLPQRAQIDQSGTSLSMMGVELGRTLVQTATAIYDPGLGKESQREKSGRAILALQQQGDAGTSNYAWNMTNITMPYEARVVLNWMRPVYDRPGRVTTVLGGEDDVKPVMLGKPFVIDPKTGRPTAVPPNTTGAKFYDLRAGGRYSTSVSIGRAYQTRLQEGAQEIGSILESSPELMPIIGPTYFRFRDFPGAKEIADILKRWRASKYPGLEDPDQPMSAEQAQAEVMALKQQMTEMQQMLQQAMQKIETDEAKQKATLAKAEMDNQTKLQIASLGQQEAVQKGAIDATLEQIKQQFEGAQNELDRRLEVFLAKFEAAHEAAMAAAGGNTATFRREDGQEQGREDESERSQGRSSSSEESGESGFDQQPQGGE